MIGIIAFGDLKSDTTKEGEIMLIHLVEAFKRTDQVIIEETFTDFVFDDGIKKIPAVDGVRFSITLKRYGKDEVTIEGNSKAQLAIPCDRCTKEVLTDINTTFSRNIHLQDEDESAYLRGAQLDLRKFLNMQMVQEFPQKVLCSEECKGLCYECGANLNEQECTCDRGHVDVRLAHLKDLFDSKFKEV